MMHFIAAITFFKSYEQSAKINHFLVLKSEQQGQSLGQPRQKLLYCQLLKKNHFTKVFIRLVLSLMEN